METGFLDSALLDGAKNRPDADAVRNLGQVTSYAELNEAANKIAATLLEMGVESGDRVVIFAAKSQYAIAAIYGVLRVGGIYVPIDPTAPNERVRAQIKAASPSCALADTRRKLRLVESRMMLPCIDISKNIPTRVNASWLKSRAQERAMDDGAYILMTSGSTGTPKGILHTHRSGMAYATMAAKLCDLAVSDRVSHHTPLHFDMSIFDIFACAQAGACVVVIPEMHTKMPASLASLLEQEQITVWYSVPYALIQLNERGALGTCDLSKLRIVMFAGETMPPAAIKAFATHVPNAAFINAYGPTETNHCVSAKLSSNDLDGISAIPIGLPDSGVEIRVAGREPSMASGELLIASDQVMQGYWQNEKLSKQSFETLPDASGTMRKFYRTGDIVQIKSDGQIMLLGRADRQIKLRGYRIELDEIERSLANTKGVSEAAVVYENGCITAFVTGANLPDVSEITDHISQYLPAYAQPERIIPLDHFARTSTGKIDRKALIGSAHD